MYKETIQEETESQSSATGGSSNGMRRLRGWAESRSLPYLANRMKNLLLRYGVSAARAEHRTLEFVALLERYGCSPTLAVPGRVVRRHAPFIRQLQDRGVELAVHGFDHVDFRTLGAGDVTGQLARAATAFEANGIRFSGFRCPYLSYSRDMAALIPPSGFSYSSNEAIEWRPVAHSDKKHRTALYETLSRFYRASAGSERPAVPRSIDGLVEIPVSLPDDLQVLDGSAAGAAGLSELWLEILHRTHGRGEAFIVLTHPETATLARGSFVELLEEARRLSPRVWVTRLHEVGEWWRHRGSMVVEEGADGSRLSVPERGTLLARGVPDTHLGAPWDAHYRIVEAPILELPSEGRRPFVGLAPDVPGWVVSMLKDEGYVVRVGDAASQCATLLDRSEVERLGSELALLHHLDALPNPMVRLWRWPDRARSALCVTGDLDALSLLDYTDRASVVGPFARSSR